MKPWTTTQQIRIYQSETTSQQQIQNKTMSNNSSSRKQNKENENIPLLTDHQTHIFFIQFHNHHLTKKLLTIFLCILIFLLLVFILFPSDPKLSLARIRFSKFEIRKQPRISLDLSLSLLVRVRNPDFFSLEYEELDVEIGYRGKRLGFVSSDGGKIGARATSYVNATLVLDGLEVMHDVLYFLADLAKGSVPFDTQSEVKGSLRIFFFRFPIRGRISCEVFVNTNNQTIMHQDCHP